MNRITIGIIFILLGCGYGSLVFDKVYNLTLGRLVASKIISPPKKSKDEQSNHKVVTLMYSLGLIIIGFLILWTNNN